MASIDHLLRRDLAEHQGMLKLVKGPVAAYELPLVSWRNLGVERSLLRVGFHFFLM